MLVSSKGAKQGCDQAFEGPLVCFNKNWRVHSLKKTSVFNPATANFLLKLVLQIISLHTAVKAAKGSVHSWLHLWDSAVIKSAGIIWCVLKNILNTVSTLKWHCRQTLSPPTAMTVGKLSNRRSEKRKVSAFSVKIEEFPKRQRIVCFVKRLAVPRDIPETNFRLLKFYHPWYLYLPLRPSWYFPPGGKS